MPNPYPRDQHRDQRFVAHLEELVKREDRAALAALRRGLGKALGEAPEMYRYVVPWVGSNTPRWTEDAYYLVAALFAVHQQSWHAAEGQSGATNLGTSLRFLQHKTESERKTESNHKTEMDSVERRLVAMLNSHRDDLPDHLRHSIGLLHSNDVLVDWLQLLRDIQSWGRPGNSVQRAWARAFWRGREEEDTGAETTATPQ